MAVTADRPSSAEVTLSPSVRQNSDSTSLVSASSSTTRTSNGSAVDEGIKHDSKVQKGQFSRAGGNLKEKSAVDLKSLARTCRYTGRSLSRHRHTNAKPSTLP